MRADRARLRKRLRRDFVSPEQLWEETEQFVRELPFYFGSPRWAIRGRNLRIPLN
jgi:hypothetical protein